MDSQTPFAGAGTSYLFYAPKNCSFHSIPTLHQPVLRTIHEKMFPNPGRFVKAHSMHTF